MANRLFENRRYSLEKKVVDLFAYVDIGGTGAPTLNAAKSKGVKSISRTSTGLYVVTLSDSYRRLLNFAVTCKVAAASYPAAPTYQLVTDAVATVAAPAITFQMNNAANSGVADPASGEVLLLTFTLSDSSAF